MRLMIAAGGTGGHVIPAVAIADAVKGLDPSAEILFVGTPQGMENDLVPRAGYALERIRLRGLKGKRPVEKIRNLACLPGAFWKTARLLGRFAPDAVFGIGGYASGPLLLLASFGGARTAILEPNAVPGFANRLLSRFVDQVFVAFEEASGRFPRAKCIVTGNPIRSDILKVPPPSFDGTRRGILIFGGSQGARRINEALMGMLPTLGGAERERLRFVHQTGSADFERVRDVYRTHGIEAEVRPFIPDMADAFRKSDLVIARSGSSVLEIAACGRPSVLIPFPHAADDHQRANARVLERAGAAVVIEDEALDARTLSMTLRTLLDDPARLRVMSGAALSLRFDGAAAMIASRMIRGTNGRRA